MPEYITSAEDEEPVRSDKPKSKNMGLVFVTSPLSTNKREHVQVVSESG